MSLHFYPIPVKAVRRETQDAVSIELDIPADLQGLFQYTQGQYLTFKTQIAGQEVRRSYSLCSSPLDNSWCVAVKNVPEGLFSTMANQSLKAGDILEVMPPIGKFFTPLDPTRRKHYLGIAAGSGITPVLSLIKTILATEPESSFTLLYGNKNSASILFRESLEALKNLYVRRFSLYHVLSREKREAPLFNGRLDVAKCEAFFDTLIPLDSVDEVFICGPEEMTLDLKEALENKGFPSRQIHFELFNTPGVAYQKRKVEEAPDFDESLESAVELRLDGNIIAFRLKYGEQNILDAALAQGADLPFACKGGVCCTCKAKLLEGEVAMDVNYGLEPEEIEAGYILTCQAHPRAEKLFVDFDAH